MISKIITKGLSTALRLRSSFKTLHLIPQYSFGRVSKAKDSNKFRAIIEQEIKSEQKQLIDIKQDEKTLQKAGWTVSKDNCLIQLYKKAGVYEVRMISQIKAPSNPPQSQETPQQSNQNQQEPDQNDMNQVTILINRSGTQKTMIVEALVSQGFEISSIFFADSLEKAKSHRYDIFESNHYTGPVVDTLSEELFNSINSFLQEELGVQGQILQDFVTYCTNYEQRFYIEWLKDVRDML